MARRNGNNFMYSRSYFKRSLKWQNLKLAEKPRSVTWRPAQVCLDPPAASLDVDYLWRRNTRCLPAHAQDIDPHQQIRGQRGQHQLRLQRHGAPGRMHPSFDRGNTPDSQHYLREYLGGVADQWATVVAKWSTRQLLLRGRKFNFIILLKEKKIINTIKRLQTVTARHSLSLVWDAPLGKLKPECLHQPWNTTELNSPTLFRSEWKLNNPNSCFRNIKFRCLNSQFSCCNFFFFVNFHIFG